MMRKIIDSNPAEEDPVVLAANDISSWRINHNFLPLQILPTSSSSSSQSSGPSEPSSERSPGPLYRQVLRQQARQHNTRTKRWARKESPGKLTLTKLCQMFSEGGERQPVAAPEDSQQRRLHWRLPPGRPRGPGGTTGQTWYRLLPGLHREEGRAALLLQLVHNTRLALLYNLGWEDELMNCTSAVL